MQPTMVGRAAAVESTLLNWVAQPSPRKCIRFAGPGDQWEEWSYVQLAAAIRRTAAGLKQAGARRDDVIVVVLPTGPDFVVTFLGAMLAGAVPAPAAPLHVGQDAEAYTGHLGHLIRSTAAKLVVTTGALRGLLRGTTRGAEVVCVDELGQSGEIDLTGPVAELAMLQFTSGSTRRPRGVRLPVGAVESAVAAIGTWLRQGPDDPTASWLPMHHDMGLIGCLLTPIVHQSDLWLMTPGQFIRDPLRYLRCFGHDGARLTAMPTFGLRHIAQRVRAEQLAGLDFSAWRAVIVGAERVSEGALEDFWRLLAPHGFARRSLLPAYGLAEATLAVTGLALDVEWTAVPVDPRRSTLGAPVPVADGPDTTPAVGCGAPLAGVTIKIRGEDGRQLADGALGEIEVTGRCVAAGYHGAATDEPPSRFACDTVLTGDAGFLREGQLFVLGRLGDSIKLRGRRLFAEDVETALEEAGLPRYRHVVLLGQTAHPVAVLVVENADPVRLARATPVLARLTEGAEVIVISAPAGTIARTTSGKPRRRQMWLRFRNGELPAAKIRGLLR